MIMSKQGFQEAACILLWSFDASKGSSCFSAFKKLAFLNSSDSFVTFSLLQISGRLPRNDLSLVTITLMNWQLFFFLFHFGFVRTTTDLTTGLLILFHQKPFILSKCHLQMPGDSVIFMRGKGLSTLSFSLSEVPGPAWMIFSLSWSANLRSARTKLWLDWSVIFGI